MTDAQRKEFIAKITPLIIKYAPQYGRSLSVVSAIIAQACMESTFGTSDKVYHIENGKKVWTHNYFGLKWRNKRCAISNDWFVAVGSEQDPNTGEYKSGVMKWCKFNSMEDCVIGYFQWTNISNYANLKTATTPQQYLEFIKADQYATSINYVQTAMNFITKYNLTQYDKKQTATTPTTPNTTKKYYRVQVGAYSMESNAKAMATRLKAAGYNCIIKKVGKFFKCQVGAYSIEANANKTAADLKAKGFNTFIVYN